MALRRRESRYSNYSFNLLNGLRVGRVTNLAALRAAVKGTTAKIVKVSGVITGGASISSPSHFDEISFFGDIDGEVVDIGSK